MSKSKDGATLLREYIEARRLTMHEFAERMGSTHASVSRWLSRDRIPGTAQAVEIERVTRGAVPVAAWVCEMGERDR